MMQYIPSKKVTLIGETNARGELFVTGYNDEDSIMRDDDTNRVDIETAKTNHDEIKKLKVINESYSSQPSQPSSQQDLLGTIASRNGTAKGGRNTRRYNKNKTGKRKGGRKTLIQSKKQRK